MAPETTPDLYSRARVHDLLDSHLVDIRDQQAVGRVVRSARPQVVLHLAAQALVRESYEQPVSTFSTNVMGTVHLLEALRNLDSIRAAVMITTDKVYENREWAYPYRESDALGGHDPYAASKAACELVIASYRDAFLRAQGVAVASARAGNVIGGGDWARDRLLPDAIRAWQSGRRLAIRFPDATRPWQHVLEPLRAYLVLAQRLCGAPDLAAAYNFGPASEGAATVRQVVGSAQLAYGVGETEFAAAHAGAMHEANMLGLETAKARHVLNIEPRWHLNTAVEKTMLWYRAFDEGADALALCHADLSSFEAHA